MKKNRHGRIVSKKKSEVARRLNNLGNFLASKAKAAKAGPAKQPKVVQPKPKVVPAKPKVVQPKPKVVQPKPKPKPKVVPAKPKPKPKPKTAAERRAAMRKAMMDKGLIKHITKDPEVIAERKKKERHIKSRIDPANIIPNQRAGLPGKLKKAPHKKKKPETIDLTGGKLRKITQKQLDRAKKKPVPRRPKKRRRKKKVDLGLMV